MTSANTKGQSRRKFLKTSLVASAATVAAPAIAQQAGPIANLLARRAATGCESREVFFQRLADAAPQGADFGDGFGRLYRRVCADGPRGDVPPAFYTLPPARSATLVLSGGADPATPPRHGQRVVQALGPKARHQVVAHAGHGVMALPCMRDVLHRFIDAETDADALQVDTQCASRVPRPVAHLPVRAP